MIERHHLRASLLSGAAHHVTAVPPDLRFAGSHPAESHGFLRDVKILKRKSSGKKLQAVGPESGIYTLVKEAQA